MTAPLMSSLAFADRPARAEIKLGKWVGFLQADGQSEGIALSMDSLIVKPSDLNEYPHLTFLVTLGLGGYQTSEYQTEYYGDPHYDFDQGLLTLDSPTNDMVITALVYADPTEMKGRAFIRSSATWATVYLLFQSDEPAEGPPTEATPPLAPKLAGQYEGTCGTEAAALQIETGRGLTDEAPPVASGLFRYTITGALGIANGRCSSVNGAGRPSWCIDHGFSAGTYDFLSGKLQLKGGLESDTCTRVQDGLTCTVRMVPADPDATRLVAATCELRKIGTEIRPYRSSFREFDLNPTPAALQPLPAPFPPFSSDLVRALSGGFSGYLHHTATNKYQPVRLNVVATTSTENSHNPNAVYLSTTSVLYFDATAPTDFWSQKFDRQPFNLVKGFTLSSADSDAFLQVTRWTQAYVEGDWYSKQFGWIGTFQVSKGGVFPPLPAAAKPIENVSGMTFGPQERMDSPDADHWELDIQVPNQPLRSDKSYLLFHGNYRLFAGGVGWPTRRITRGAYDVYSGAVAWVADDSTGDAKVVSGSIASDGLKLFWPNDRVWSVSVLDWSFGTYLKN